MKNFVLFILLINTLISCSFKPDVPENSVIVSKYIVFDENISPGLNVCPDAPEDYSNNPSACIFKLDKFIFQPEYNIILNDKGNMIKQEQHTIINDIDYEKNGIEKDTTNWEKINGLDFWIRFSKDRSEILDVTDTIKIDRIFAKEKLIFVEKSTEKKGRRYIYQYK